MNIYKGHFLNVRFEEKDNRFINSWNLPPDSIETFKSELLEYRGALEKMNPTQIIWLQKNFKFNIDDQTKFWVEENILKPRFEAGFVTADKDGFHPIAFVVGQDVLSHMKVMGVFDKPSPSVFNPKHFATEQEARDWLNKEFTINNIENSQTEILYKGISEKGEAIVEIRSTPSEIENTIKSFKSILEENNFIKSHIEEYSSLSKREIEVLELLGQGSKHQDIAEELFISIHTVRDHIKKIKEKLHVKSKFELQKYFSAFLKNK